MMQNSQSIQKHYMNEFMEICSIYLKLISDATRGLNDNRGSLRRDIWAYLMKEYGLDTVRYVDFLKSIQ